MKKKKLSLVVLFLAFLFTTSTQAQQTTVASGGDATGSGGSVAYSIGQVAYTTLSDNATTLSQGVQQIYDISTVGTKETKLNISLSVFPNPTANDLTLKVENYNNENFYFQLTDNQGKLIKTEKIISNQTRIDMKDFSSAIYFINVTKENKTIQSFKIIKN